jgi:hypothetical protein
MSGPCHGNNAKRIKYIFDFQLPIADLKSQIGNLKSREVEMTEAVEESMEGGHETLTRVTGYEPEILSFCCEH